jgi:hypothetical protein
MKLSWSMMGSLRLFAVAMSAFRENAFAVMVLIEFKAFGRAPLPSPEVPH